MTSGPRGGKPNPYDRRWRKLREQAFALYGRACYLCGKYADQVDHLDPVQWFGTGLPSIDRVRPICRRCNIARGNRTRDRYGTAAGHSNRITSREW